MVLLIPMIMSSLGVILVVFIGSVCPVNEDPDNDMELAREEGGVFWVAGERRIRWIPGKKHDVEVHNFWVKERHMVCPYCKAGSVPVPRDEIVNGLKEG
jgi:hypothetical protein